MRTIAVNRKSYINVESVSFAEKLRKYFKENSKLIVAGLLSMNGNASVAAQTYRMMK